MMVLFASTAVAGHAQFTADEQREPESKGMRELIRQQEKARNAERHKDLKQDTEKLLQLATELKSAVDQSNENTLSMDVLKKAEQIEKLSKSVQKKMRGY
jgi:hypothetical protein